MPPIFFFKDFLRSEFPTRFFLPSIIRNLEVVYHVLRHFVDIKFDHLLWFFLLEADNFYFFCQTE